MTTLAEKVAANRPAGSGSPATAKGNPAGGNAAGLKGHAASGNAGAKGGPASANAAPIKAAQASSGGTPAKVNAPSAAPAEKAKGPVLAPEKRKALGRGLESLLGPPRVVPSSAPVRATPTTNVAGSGETGQGPAAGDRAGQRSPEAERSLGMAGEAAASTQASSIQRVSADAGSVGVGVSDEVAGTPANSPSVLREGEQQDTDGAPGVPGAMREQVGSPVHPGAVTEQSTSAIHSRTTAEQGSAPGVSAAHLDGASGTGHSEEQSGISVASHSSGFAASGASELDSTSDSGWHAPAPGTFTGANLGAPQDAAVSGMGSAGVPIPGTLMAVDVARDSSHGTEREA